MAMEHTGGEEGAKARVPIFAPAAAATLGAPQMGRQSPPLVRRARRNEPREAASAAAAAAAAKSSAGEKSSGLMSSSRSTGTTGAVPASKGPSEVAGGRGGGVMWRGIGV